MRFKPQGSAFKTASDALKTQGMRVVTSDRPHPLRGRPALRNSSSGAAHLANSDSARAGSGVPSKDTRGLIDPARLPAPVAHSGFADCASFKLV
jgi:hypothetical protein